MGFIIAYKKEDPLRFVNLMKEHLHYLKVFDLNKINYSINDNTNNIVAREIKNLSAVTSLLSQIDISKFMEVLPAMTIIITKALDQINAPF
jgi:hypothetical protein